MEDANDFLKYKNSIKRLNMQKHIILVLRKDGEKKMSITKKRQRRRRRDARQRHVIESIDVAEFVNFSRSCWIRIAKSCPFYADDEPKLCGFSLVYSREAKC